MDRESIDFNEGNPTIVSVSTLLQCLGGTQLIFIVLDETLKHLHFGCEIICQNLTLA